MSNSTHAAPVQAPAPADVIAQQMERLQAQAMASLAEAQQLVQREQQRLATILEQKPEPPQPQRFDLANGLDVIRRTMESTSDYLAKHLANRPVTTPASVPTTVPSAGQLLPTAPLPEMPTL